MTAEDTIHTNAASAASSDDASDKSKFSPLDWHTFFDTKHQVSIPIELDSSKTTFSVYEINRERTDLPVIVLHHGAGHCALSFAATAKELRTLIGDQARILCYDARGHGETTSTDQLNLDIDRLAKDLQNVLLTYYTPSSSIMEGVITMPELFLVGHSMGGAVVTEVATRELVPHISGIAVLDMAQARKEIALIYIRQWCENRPATCKTVEQAIQWGVESGTVRNIESARVSFPGMVKRSPTESKYTWYTDLMASESHWPSWFDGLNQKFLNTKPKKFLILGENKILDDEMTAAHEQGKFKLSVFAEAGHAVQEDDPVRMAKELAEFWKKD
ncbi:hypothetical protein BGX27_001016 [Mortierella sp. AM989]|nr:hypothetical protein BGX27_001016 [Mortierella sp. AM989]